MSKFKIGDKVKLTHPNNIYEFVDYIDEWKEFWYDNKNTVFSIHFDINIYFNIYFHLQYPNGDKVMNVEFENGATKIATFRYGELELYINPLPDELILYLMNYLNYNKT